MTAPDEMDEVVAFVVAVLGVGAALIFGGAVWLTLVMLPGLPGLMGG